MNKRRMNKLIKALKTEAARNMFDMGEWGLTPEGAKSPAEAFKSGGGCGTTACMAGIAAIIDSKYFHTKQSLDDETGKTYYYWEIDGGSPTQGFADWLGVSYRDADRLTSPDSDLWEEHKNTNIAHAINVLEAYRDGGMDKVESLI